MQRLIIASSNKDKVREIKEILYGIYEVVSMKEAGIEMHIVEDGTTFEQNAMKKATALYGVLKEPVLSDDSGLCVDALNGAPGVYSARYAGEHCSSSDNNAKLLKEMAGIQNRQAKFVCAMVYYNGEDDNYTVRGEVKGSILNKPSGTNGFGYDSLFFCDEINMGFGVAPNEIKNSVSHRARALKQMTDYLKTKNQIK